MLTKPSLLEVRQYVTHIAVTFPVSVVIFCGSIAFLLYIYPPKVSALYTCNSYQSFHRIPTGYGAAYDVFQANKETILNADCGMDDFRITIGHEGKTPQNFAVYKTGYRWTGSAWQAIPFSPNGGSTQGDYILGKAVSSGSAIDYASGSNTFFVAFTCSLQSGAWKCGCRDNTCATHHWQLQGASYAGGITTPTAHVTTDTETSTDDDSSTQPVRDVTPRFSQSVVDKACSAPLIDFRKANSNGQRQFDDNAGGELNVAHAVAYLALVAYFEPNRSCAGTSAKVRLRDQLKNVVIGGREPAPNAGLNGFWTYSQFAMAIALAKQTPAVWSSLSADDKDRLDWLMRALTVTSAYGIMYNSYPSHSLTDTIYTLMGYSFPNHWMGWHATMVYAMDYFGGSAGLNAFLKGFDYDALMSKARSFGWTRMTSSNSLGGTYPGTPRSIKELLYNGGRDMRGNVIASVRQDFFMQVDYGAKKGGRVEASRKTNDPWKMFADMTRHYMFSGKVVNETQIQLNAGSYRTGLLDRSKSSPYLDEYVQASEWATRLSPEFSNSSYRSNGHYVSAGLSGYMPWAGFMRARGYWDRGADGSSLKNHIIKGFRDTQFKVDVGWSGRTNDGTEEIWNKDAFYSDFWGGTWITDIHDGLVAQ